MTEFVYNVGTFPAPHVTIHAPFPLDSAQVAELASIAQRLRGNADSLSHSHRFPTGRLWVWAYAGTASAPEPNPGVTSLERPLVGRAFV